MSAIDREELWVRVIGWPGYEVSTHGRVRSLDRRDGLGRLRDGQVLRPARDGRVMLCGRGRQQLVSVGRLVWAAFIGEPVPALVVRVDSSGPWVADNLRDGSRLGGRHCK